MNLEHARVWLTGASSGIGEAVAGALAGAGARIALTARRQDRLEKMSEPWLRAGREVLVVPADVTDREGVLAAARRIEEAWGGIDLAFFNAGIGKKIRWTEFDAREFTAIYQVNLFGVMHGVEAVLPGMLRRRAGRIAAVASLAGYRGAPTLAGYGSSKAALIHAMDSLRFDLAPHGIAVTLINPGYVRTPLTADNRYWMPALMDAGRAAAIILRGLQQDRKEIHFPARFSWTLKFLRALPFPLYERIVTAAVKRGAR